MPLQNRVNPFGQLEAVSARGGWLGNRGILHNERRKIVTQWRSKAWITCVLHYRGVHRKVFSPHTWSELFFLDEATAFAAGHRPCAYCRRARYSEFKRAWLAANPGLVHSLHPRATDIDAQLHAERVAPGGGKQTFRARMGKLPPGTFIALDSAAFLLWKDRLYPWSHFGYGRPVPLPPADSEVTVLTPRSVVAMFRGDLQPQVDASAGG